MYAPLSWPIANPSGLAVESSSACSDQSLMSLASVLSDVSEVDSVRGDAVGVEKEFVGMVESNTLVRLMFDWTALIGCQFFLTGSWKKLCVGFDVDFSFDARFFSNA